MAQQPNPEFLSEYMNQAHGTKVLITNPKADYYLDQYAKGKKEDIPEKYQKWCGGPGGWDDYTERMHSSKEDEN